MKKILLIWYNPNSDRTYEKVLDYGIDLYLNDYKVGYINAYGHIIIDILVFLDHEIINCNNYYDYYLKLSKYNNIYVNELDRINNYLFYGRGGK